MTHDPSARDWLGILCYGTLYERLTAAVAVSEDAQRAAAEWNEYVDMLSTFGLSGVYPVHAPTIDPLALQRRILTAYADHPLLRNNQALEDVFSHHPAGLDSLVVATSNGGEVARQITYIDRVRRELGLIAAYCVTA